MSGIRILDQRPAGLVSVVRYGAEACGTHNQFSVSFPRIGFDSTIWTGSFAVRITGSRSVSRRVRYRQYDLEWKRDEWQTMLTFLHI